MVCSLVPIFIHPGKECNETKWNELVSVVLEQNMMVETRTQAAVTISIFLVQLQYLEVYYVNVVKCLF